MVDDEESIRRNLKAFLEDYGHKVTVFASGVEALDLFVKDPNSFDLIYTDMTMPEMTGLEFISKCRAIRPDIPVIISSGHNSVINSENATKFGVNAYIAKPASINEILKTIQSILK